MHSLYKPDISKRANFHIIAKKGAVVSIAFNAKRFRIKFLALGIVASTGIASMSRIYADNLPVVLIHGIMADAFSMLPMQQLIYKHLPGTYVKNLQIGAGYITSFWNMYAQVDWLRREIQKDPRLKNGCNIVAHSQGGLVARYFVERYNKPQVYNYIALGTPQQGVMGTPGDIDNRFSWLNIAELYAYRLLYSSLFQRYVSFAGYWHDSLHLDDYLKKCEFLPEINNEISHSYSKNYRDNICRLQNMVLVKSTQEDIIEPAISCHFGFYRPGSISETQDLTESQGFAEDILGLRTLHESGRLHLRLTQAKHEDLQDDEDCFIQNILPFLKLERPPQDMTIAETIDPDSAPEKNKKQKKRTHIIA